MTDFDRNNDKQVIADRMINNTSQSVFLTGKAGTGKTTFLRYLKTVVKKQIAIVAPTGVAAVNAGGVTIHSFFQLPFSTFLPEERGLFTHNLPDHEAALTPLQLIKQLKLNEQKLKLMRQLELLVIDEVSMLRCDTLDAIDTVLKHVRKNPYQAFGGVQILFIGDLFQLAPVIKNEEWPLLSPFYKSAFFFESMALRNNPPVFIEFEKIYRQKDTEFINLLNEIRDGVISTSAASLLQRRQIEYHADENDEEYVILTTHNNIAKTINEQRLAELNTPVKKLFADVEGQFSEYAYPADNILELKEGAKVMFIKNDTDFKKRFFNGKTGEIIKIGTDSIEVYCKSDDSTIEVNKAVWENIQYVINQQTGKITSEVVGRFKQYPLKTAWAITIHKSQGLTFEKAIIDAGRAFAPGQVYVALSRCTSLNGLLLKTPVTASSLHTHATVQAYTEFLNSRTNYSAAITEAEKLYIKTEIQNCFRFYAVNELVSDIAAYTDIHRQQFSVTCTRWVQEATAIAAQLDIDGNKFINWVEQKFGVDAAAVEEKTKKAVVYFGNIISGLLQLVTGNLLTTEIKKHALQVNDLLKEAYKILHYKSYLIKNLKWPLEASRWQEQKNEYVVPAFNINIYKGVTEAAVGILYPELYAQLMQLRDAIVQRTGKPIYLIANKECLLEICNNLPITGVALENIKGFGPAKVKNFGNEFIELVKEYCYNHQLEGNAVIVKSKKQKN